MIDHSHGPTLLRNTQGPAPHSTETLCPWPLVLCVFTLAAGSWSCGESSSDDATCQSKATTFRICDEDRLLECPSGGGEWVDMVQVKDCAAAGEVCHDPLVSDPACKDPQRRDNIVGDAAARYSEQDDTGNNQTAEATGYTLDEKGIIISGSLGAGDADSYRFHAGAFSRLDLQAFVGVNKLGATVTLDAAEDDGYSTLRGNGTFLNAGLPNPGVDYDLTIHSADATAYTIEFKGNP